MICKCFEIWWTSEFVWFTQPLFALQHHLTRCAHGNHPRVQEPLVLSITVEVHHLLKPALISQSFDLLFAPFPTGIAYKNAMQPASMSPANPFYLPFYKCKSQVLFKCTVIPRRLSQLHLSQPAPQIWSTDWNDVHFALTTYLVQLCDVVQAALIQFPPHLQALIASYCAPAQLLQNAIRWESPICIDAAWWTEHCLSHYSCRNSTAVKKTQPFKVNRAALC